MDVENLTNIAWEILEQSIIYYYDSPVGTVAACDRETPALNYDQCFVRDFIPAALVFLTKGKTEIVRNFLIHTLKLQIKERQLDFLEPGRGLMPASFKVIDQSSKQYLQADFGDRFAPQQSLDRKYLDWICHD